MAESLGHSRPSRWVSVVTIVLPHIHNIQYITTIHLLFRRTGQMYTNFAWWRQEIVRNHLYLSQSWTEFRFTKVTLSISWQSDDLGEPEKYRMARDELFVIVINGSLIQSIDNDPPLLDLDHMEIFIIIGSFHQYTSDIPMLVCNLYFDF